MSRDRHKGNEFVPEFSIGDGAPRKQEQKVKRGVFLISFLG